MSLQNPKDSPDDAVRMEQAQRRLEEILANPGPGITVTPTERYDDELPSNAAYDVAPTTTEPNSIDPTQQQAQPVATHPSALLPTSQPKPEPLQYDSISTRPARILSKPALAPQQPPVQPAAPTQPRPTARAQPQAQPPAPASATAAPPAASPHAAKADTRATPTTHAAQRQTQRAQPRPQKRPHARPQIPTPKPTQATAPPAKPAVLDTPQRTVTGQRGELANALMKSKRAFMAAGLFSFVINILMLAGPLFMLQVYDRVLASGSMPTLVALAVMVTAAYAIIGILELVRSRVIVRMGLEVDQRISTRVFDASMRHSLTGTGQSNQAMRELDSIRQFVASPGPLTFFDAPWTPIYLFVIFMAHWALGIAATIGALILLVVAWISEVRSRDPQVEAGVAGVRAHELAETGQKNAEALTAMGMVDAYRTRWERANNETLAWQLVASDQLGEMTALSKSLKLLFQSMMLALGAALAIEGLISPGVIIAATIIFGRALAPVDQAIGHWRQFLKARTSYAKLDALLGSQPPEARKTALPDPKGHLKVTDLRVAAPGTRQLILANIAFAIEPGQALAVIGPSASGKSTLVRTLVGVWKPATGAITLDGARLDQWDAHELGRHIGYLPQSVELFSGSVKENIARFIEDARDDEVVEAAKQAHAHELILALPDGYETQLGAFATHLSGGQRQRLALARALFRNPPLVILDEPNANLDRDGDVALAGAIDGCRARGQAVVLVSHRIQAIGKADMLLYLDKGIQRAFGPRDDVMKMLQDGVNQPQPRAAHDSAPRPQDKQNAERR